MLRAVKGSRKALGMSIFVLSALASVPGCSSYYGEERQTGVQPETTDYDIVQGLTYTPTDWPQALKGDLYLPQQNKPSPVILMVHGGGWNSRSPADMVWIAEELAGHGFAVFNIAYRFAPEYTFPAQLHDLQLARQWLGDNGERYQLDTQRVSGFGFSSGAHLIALLATVAVVVLQGLSLGEIHSSVQNAGALVPDYASLQIWRILLLVAGLGCWICPLVRRKEPSVGGLALGLVSVLAGEIIGRGLFYGLHMTVGMAVAG